MAPSWFRLSQAHIRSKGELATLTAEHNFLYTVGYHGTGSLTPILSILLIINYGTTKCGIFKDMRGGYGTIEKLDSNTGHYAIIKRRLFNIELIK